MSLCGLSNGELKQTTFFKNTRVHADEALVSKRINCLVIEQCEQEQVADNFVLKGEDDAHLVLPPVTSVLQTLVQTAGCCM